MPRGDKSAYTGKQKRNAEHIEESYESRGVSKKEAESRAWATVNEGSGGGNKSGSGCGVPDNQKASEKGGKLGGRASASRTAEERSASAKKGAATRKRNAAKKRSVLPTLPWGHRPVLTNLYFATYKGTSHLRPANATARSAVNFSNASALISSGARSNADGCTVTSTARPSSRSIH